jgi:hypothetical protein
MEAESTRYRAVYHSGARSRVTQTVEALSRDRFEAIDLVARELGAPAADSIDSRRFHRQALICAPFGFGNDHMTVPRDAGLMFVQAGAGARVITEHRFVERQVEKPADRRERRRGLRDEGLVSHFQIVGDASCELAGALDALAQSPAISAMTAPGENHRRRTDTATSRPSRIR